MVSVTGVKSIFFFFNDTATTEIYTLSLHDALPISPKHQTTMMSKKKKIIMNKPGKKYSELESRFLGQIGRAHVWTPVTL